MKTKTTKPKRKLTSQPQVGSSEWLAELEAEYLRIEKLRERADKGSNDGMIEWHLNCAGVAMGDAINRSRSANGAICGVDEANE